MYLPIDPLIDTGSGEPIVLLPGKIYQIDSWIDLINGLSVTNRVIVPRLPFHSADISGFRMADLTTYLFKFVKGHHLGRSIFIGAGAGEQLALHFAKEFPWAVVKLILTRDFQTSLARPRTVKPNEYPHDEKVEEATAKAIHDRRVISRVSTDSSSDLKLFKQIFFQINQRFPILIFHDHSFTFRSFGKVKVQSYNSAPLERSVHLLPYIQKFILQHDG